MPEDPAAITLSLVLTAAGATVAAALITGLVQLLKSVLPIIGNGNERITAFVLSAILVVIAVAAGVQDDTMTLNIATLFGAFIAWYGIARLSMGIFADVSQEPNSITGQGVSKEEAAAVAPPETPPETEPAPPPPVVPPPPPEGTPPA